MGFIKLKDNNSPIISENDPFNEILKSLNINDFTLPYPENEVEKSINALKKIILIAKVYNEGWVPRMEDSRQRKFFPYKYMNSAGVWVCSYYWGFSVGFPLGVYFKSSELAMKAIDIYEDIYDDYFMIKKD